MHDWVGTVISWELCKGLKFDHSNKWLESVFENENHKILWNVEIQTDDPLSNRRPDMVLICKKKELIIK